MRNQSALIGKFWSYAVIFYVSFFCICLELFLTRILNLKTFNHVVYVVIPFAILGYGVGANLYLLTERLVNRLSSRVVVAASLIALGVSSLMSVFWIIQMPLSVKLLQEFFESYRSGLMLSLAYLVLMIPFVVIGYIILFFFSNDPKHSSKLYFWDLLGAGAGALGFFVLIYKFQVVHSLIILAVGLIALSFVFILPRLKWVALVIFMALTIAGLRFVPENLNYASDAKGWENFPKFFKPEQFETILSKWHPLGRTDVYHILGEQRQKLLYYQAEGTFQINLKPKPDFSYFSTNFLGGTPVYKLSVEGLNERNSKLELFTQAMEFPYVLLKQPKVLVIGAGGGRDIFMAKTHGATEVWGAEINPQIYREMTPGGKMYDYSGQVYTLPGVQVENIDGRNLVKRLDPQDYDLVILNGVDTFYGLSTGAYAYAESYLYTKNAIKDYWRILKPNGMINFNRWIFLDQGMDRETLRLMVIILEALREAGVPNPWEHIMIGAYNGWGMTLVKKSPFNGPESDAVISYFEKHHTELIYPSKALSKNQREKLNFFDLCALSFIQGIEKNFIDSYRFDISAITDDNPFFYKYYRFSDFKPKELNKASMAYSNYGAGFVIFLTQGLVLFNAAIFCLLFIGLPLLVMRKAGLTNFSGISRLTFIVYYACLGVGFMFIEIPLMQKFALLLGSPIYSISVTLAGLLIFSGIGSGLLSVWQKYFKNSAQLIWIMTGVFILSTLALIYGGEMITAQLISASFPVRIGVVCLLLFPFGISLGIFFPSGLSLISKESKGAVAWAWGINCGFSVVGSMLSIILAQFHGFNLILRLAIFIYVLAAISFSIMAQKFNGRSV